MDLRFHNIGGNYWHFQTSLPGGTAAGDAENAEKVFNWLIGFSLLEPKGQIDVVGELNLIMGGTRIVI